MNIRMEYLYRDAGNYKNWGEVVFSNPNSLPICLAEQMVSEFLIERQYFLANSVGLPDLHFAEHNDELDHDWHEFHAFAFTKDASDDLQGRSIEKLIDCLRSKCIV